MAKKKNKSKKTKSLGYQIYENRTPVETLVYGIQCARCARKFTLIVNGIPSERLIKKEVVCPFTDCQDGLTVYYDFKENKRFVYDKDTTVVIGKLTWHERKTLCEVLSGQYKKELHNFQKRDKHVPGQGYYLHMLKNVCDKVFGALEEGDTKLSEMSKLDAVIDSKMNVWAKVEPKKVAIPV